MNPRSCLVVVACLALPLVLVSCAQDPAASQQRRAEVERQEAEKLAAYRRSNEAYERARLEQAAKDDPERAKRGAAREEARKATCGADYHAPRIGMPFERAMQCLGALRLATQVNRGEGMVSTYQGADLYVEELRGKVVGWGAR